MHQLTQKRKTTVMIALMATMFFAAINQTIISAALPKVIAQLGGMDYYSWVITGYMLTSTISTVIFGKLSDIYGRKIFLLSGIIIFLIGSFLTGLSANIFQMIAFRGIQGIGGGILMSISLTAVGDLYPPQERAKWTGVMMSIFGISSILGPVLGGVMVDYVAWKWLFWIFLPLGVVALIMIWSLFPKLSGNSSESIDYLGSIFLALSITSLLLGFSWAGTKFAWASPQILGLFGATLVGILVLILIERNAKSPVMPLSMFKNKGVTISFVASFVMSVSMIIMANMNNIVWAAISLIIFGVGLGFGMTVFTTTAQNSAPTSQLGVVTASCTLFRNLGGTIFIAIFGSIMNTSMARNMEKVMSSGSRIDLTKLDVETAEKFKAMANPQLLLDNNKLEAIQASMTEQVQLLFSKMMDLVRTVMGDALTSVFYIGALLLLVGVVLSLFLKVQTADKDNNEEFEEKEEAAA